MPSAPTPDSPRDVLIVTASPAERAVAAMLCPGAVINAAEPSEPALIEPTVLVALTDDRRHMLGAAVLGCVVAGEPVGAPCCVHVPPAHRGRGIARSLLTAVRRVAGGWGVPTVASWEPVPTDSPEAGAWRGLGFASHTADTAYLALTGSIRRVIEPVWMRLISRGRTMGAYRVVDLREADGRAVHALLALHLGPSATRRPMMEGGTRGGSPEVGCAVVMGDETLGVIVARHRQGGGLIVTSRVTRPDLRQSWVNARLLSAAVELCGLPDDAPIEFHAGPAHDDTHRLALKVGASTIQTLVRYTLNVALPRP